MTNRLEINQTLPIAIAMAALLLPSTRAAAQFAAPTSTAPRSSARLTARPEQSANPYIPQLDREFRLPVALAGYCLVLLRDQQEWVAGDADVQLVFDRQIYWFAGPEERLVFAANPSRYAPALGGDCIVTFKQTGLRKPGALENGTLHAGRLYFFAGAEQLQQFTKNPDLYAAADLMNHGNCVVSAVDEQRELPGVPETAVYVNGLRYFFVGAHEQTKFVSNARRYGVDLSQLANRSEDVDGPADATARDNGTTQRSVAGSPAGRGLNSVEEFDSLPSIEEAVMAGYCPVSIRTRGLWLQGIPRFHAEFDSRTYFFAGTEQRDMFVLNPEAYVPVLGGDCVVSYAELRERRPGDVFFPALYPGGEGRLYLLHGEEELEKFNEDPTRYAEADLAAQGKCIVSLVDSSMSVAGLPDFETIHGGLRYRFASADQQERFVVDPNRFVERDPIRYDAQESSRNAVEPPQTPASDEPSTAGSGTGTQQAYRDSVT